MANALGRDIEIGETIILRIFPHRRFVAKGGSGLRYRSPGIELYGHFQDEWSGFIAGPLDATLIDVDATNALREKSDAD